MNGAKRRVQSCKNQIREYRLIIRSRRVVDAQGREKFLGQSQVDDIRLKKLTAEAKLFKAKNDLDDYTQLFEETVQSRSEELIKGIGIARKARSLSRKTTQYFNRSKELLAKLEENGEAKNIADLRSMALARNRAEFRVGFLTFLEAHDKEAWDHLNEMGRLRNNVILKMMRELRKEQ